MEQMLNVSSNPHVSDKMTTIRIMQLVALALLPTTLFWYLELRLPCTSCCTRDGCVQRLF